MALREIVEFPDPRLRTKAQPVTVFDAALRQLVADMFETMYEAPGIGLAATQIDVHKQLLVLDVSEDKNAPLVIINPRIVESEGKQTYQEGCLSVPGIFADVERADRIRVEAHDVDGKPQVIEADARRRVHRLEHVGDELLQRGVEHGDRRRLRAQAWVGELEDRKQGHGFPDAGAARRAQGLRF